MRFLRTFLFTLHKTEKISIVYVEEGLSKPMGVGGLNPPASPPSAPHLVLGASPVGAAAWRGLPSQGAAQQIWARGNPGAAWIPCSQAPAPQDVPQCPPLHALEEGAIGGGRGVPGSHLTRGWGCWKGAELGTTRLAAH